MSWGGKPHRSLHLCDAGVFVLLDLIVLGIVPDAVTLTGAGIILSCVVYIGFREHWQLRHMAQDNAT